MLAPACGADVGSRDLDADDCEDAALTIDQALNLGQAVATLALTLLVFVGSQFVASLKRAETAERKVIEQRFLEIEKRLDKAGQKQSDLTDKMHLLPERETVNRIWEEVVKMRDGVALLAVRDVAEATLHRAQIDAIHQRLVLIEDRRAGTRDRRGNGRDDAGL